MESGQGLIRKTITKELGKCPKHDVEVEILRFPAIQTEIVDCELCKQEMPPQDSQLRFNPVYHEPWETKSNKENLIGIPKRYQDSTLSSFIADSEEKKKMLEEAIRFLEGQSLLSGLLLLGRVGTGKTHIAISLMKEFVNKNPKEKALYSTMLKILRLIKSTWRKDAEETEESVIGALTKIPLLVVDEVGICFGTDAEKLIFNEIIGDRYNNLLPTLLIANCTVKELEAVLGDRVIDRFRDGGKVLVFDWESYRGRCDQRD